MAATQSFSFIDPNGHTERAVRRSNPDGTVGGWIAESARVHSTAIVEPDAIVEPGAVVGPEVRVRDGEIVLGAALGATER
jgi:UDP-3-O-[3-hydroxymyristoyl] glucosamine N-acyltransferase